MKKPLQRLLPIIILIVFTATAYLLYHELRHYRIHDIRRAFQQIPGWRLWVSVGLMMINYVVLIGYDVLAIRAIRHPLPFSKIALASFVGFVTSYNFGAVLGGTSVRYRLYSAWGLSALEILQLVMMVGLTFWLGIFALAGAFFLLYPFPIPATLPLPFSDVRPLGMILLGLTVGYVGLTWRRRAPLFVRGTLLRLPAPGITVLQLAVAAVDLIISSACLYVLIAPELHVGYSVFLSMYLLAVVAVIVTHIPGGLGVFELIVLTLAAPQSSATMVAALIAFRVIYYLLPLFIAALLLAANEIVLQRVLAARVWSDLGRWAGTITPTLLAWATLLAGGALLWSGATPILHARMGPVRPFVALPLVEVSHFVGSLVGAGLLLLARGLQRRLDTAWWLSVALLGLGIMTSLCKGFAYETAILLALVMIPLVACRQRFYRRGTLLHQRFTPGWVGIILLALCCSLWLGLFAYKHVEYRSALWWTFTLRGDAPRFLRASIGATAVLLIFTVRKLLSAYVPVRLVPTADELDTAARIVQTSPATQANLALLGDKSFLFNDARTAFIMYAVQGQSWVSMGDPVGAATEHADLVWRFREWADCYDGRAVFYQVGEDALPLYIDQGFTLLKLGEEARVPLATFGLDGSARKGLRQSQSRCQRAQCQFDLIPAAQVPSVLPVLTDISEAWLAAKQAAEKGFSLGFFDPQYVQRFPCAVVRQEQRIVAFATVWCGAHHEELAVDLMRYVPGAPADVMEYLFTALMLWGKQQGYQWFNLGMAPFSGIDSRTLAPLWNRAANLVFRHGEHFYSFAGLRQYKAQFHPVWRPKYLASPGGPALPRILADVIALIAQARPAQGSLQS